MPEGVGPDTPDPGLGVTQDIGSLAPFFMQHGQVPGFPFLRARVNQLLEKLFPPVKVREGQHRADRLAQPLTDLIKGLLDLLHDQPAAFEAFGECVPPREQWSPILFPGFVVSAGRGEGPADP